MTGRTATSSLLAPLFLLMAKFEPLRGPATRMVCRQEGGPLHSATYRRLLAKYSSIELGKYSYGPVGSFENWPSGTRIGSYCSIGADVSIFRRNHPTRRIAQHPFFYNSQLKWVPEDTIHHDGENPLEIGHDVWIGAHAIITPACKSIGLGSIVGAGAVVTKDVPAFTIVAGNPARPIGVRFAPPIQEELTNSRWWEFPIEVLAQSMPLFLADATIEGARELTRVLQAAGPRRN